MAKKTNVNEVKDGDIKSNVIILRSVWGKVGLKYFIQPCKDKMGRRVECVRPVDSKGDMILSDADRNSGKVFIPEDQMFVIEDGRTFNLDDPYEAAEWEAIRNCFLISEARDAKDAKGNYLIDGVIDKNQNYSYKFNQNSGGASNFRYGRAELYVERPGLESKKRVSRKRLILQAWNFIENDERGYDGMLLIAKVLGRDMSNQPSPDVKDFLFSVAEKTPEKIIELYTGGDLQLRLLFLTAKQKGVIIKKDGLYVYGEEQTVILGASDSAVIEWMKQSKNAKIIELIRKDTYPEMYD